MDIPGGWELLIICAVILVLFGGAAIPKFARSIGKAQGEFKKGMSEGAAEADSARKNSDSS